MFRSLRCFEVSIAFWSSRVRLSSEALGIKKEVAWAVLFAVNPPNPAQDKGRQSVGNGPQNLTLIDQAQQNRARILSPTEWEIFQLQVSNIFKIKAAS